MYHYVYQVENLVNGKIYVGKHSTENMDDGYMGSGKAITAAVAKHGIENFRKTILKEFSTAEEALSYESSIVDDVFLQRCDVYNLVVGGQGNEQGLNAYWRTHPQEKLEQLRQARQRITALLESDPNFALKRSSRMAELNRQRKREGKLKTPSWSGRRHTEESKKKIAKK